MKYLARFLAPEISTDTGREAPTKPTKPVATPSAGDSDPRKSPTHGGGGDYETYKTPDPFARLREGPYRTIWGTVAWSAPGAAPLGLFGSPSAGPLPAPESGPLFASSIAGAGGQQDDRHGSCAACNPTEPRRTEGAPGNVPDPDAARPAPVAEALQFLAGALIFGPLARYLVVAFAAEDGILFTDLMTAHELMGVVVEVRDGEAFWKLS